MIASSRRTRRALAILVAATFATGRAFADGPPLAPSEAQVEAARPLYREARELHAAGKLSEALDKALTAYRMAATPVTALEASGLLVELGRLVEARDLARGVGALPVSPRESDKGRDARQQAAALAAALDGRIPKIALAARSAGVTVLLDGKAVSNIDPAAWQGVDPGAHALVAMVDGKACTTINVTLAEGEERTLDLHDVAGACHAPPPPPPAGPPAIPALPPAVTPPTPAREPVATTAASSSMRWLGLGVAGVGIVAVGVGGGLALGAKSQYDSVASQCPAAGCTLDAYQTRNDARTRADAATIVMAAGAVAVAGGLVLWLLAPDPATAVGVGVGRVDLRLAF